MLFVLLLLSMRSALSVRLFAPLNRYSIVNPRFSFQSSSSFLWNQQLQSSRLHSSASDESESSTSKSGDVLITGLNEAQDISVKVISCRELVQENIFRNDLTPVAGKALGEVMTCAVMMGAGLKGETLQVNIVGSPGSGLKNVLVITDGELRVRGKVGEPRFFHRQPEVALTSELFGEGGQVQVVRNHPSYKAPINGVVALRDAKLSLNLALYMLESEQRTAVLITDVRVDGNLCRSALGLMVERLPGATEENVEQSIKNLEAVEKKGLYSYLSRTDEERKADGLFRSFDGALNKIIDDCLLDMGEGIRWNKEPTFKCSCGVERVWGVLQILPRSEIEDIVNTQDSVDMKCDFCGTNYSLSKEEVRLKLLS